jgi:alanine dehydrogenase
MRIGVPREIKVHEYRVGLVPADLLGVLNVHAEQITHEVVANALGRKAQPFRFQ